MKKKLQDIQRQHGVSASEAMQMQAATHTPAPWVSENVADREGGLNVFNIKGASYRIATVHPRKSLGVREANAALITAAPDLLAAAKAMFKTLERPNPTHMNSYRIFYDRCRSAILRAESR